MAIDTSRPRASAQPGSYDFATHGTTQASNAGNHLIRPSANAVIWSPSWNYRTTTFRPLPAKSYNGEITPYRLSPEPSKFGDWIRGYYCFKGGATGMATFALFDPTDREYDLSNNPAFVLWKAISDAVRAGQGAPAWAPMLQGSAGRGAALAKPTNVYLMQAVLLEHNSQLQRVPRGLAANDKLLIMQLSGGTGQKLAHMLNELTPGYTGAPTDYDRAFLYGDPVSLEHGRFIRMCQGGGPLSQQPGQAGQQQWSGGANPQFGGGGQNEVKGYDIVIQPDFNNLPGGACLAQFAEQIIPRAQRWDDLINVASESEQALWLTRLYPADAVEFAFRDHPEWMTPEVTDILRARMAVPSAGVPAPAYGAPAYGAPAYGAPAYGQPQPGYGAPAPAYGAPPPGYGAPAYGQPQPGYGAPAPAAAAGAWGVDPGAPQTQTPAPTYPPSVPPQGAAPQGPGAWAGVPGYDPAVRPQPGQTMMPAADTTVMGGTVMPQYAPQPGAAPFTPNAAPQGAPGAVDPRMAALAAARNILAGGQQPS